MGSDAVLCAGDPFAEVVASRQGSPTYVFEKTHRQEGREEGKTDVSECSNSVYREKEVDAKTMMVDREGRAGRGDSRCPLAKKSLSMLTFQPL